MLCVVSGDYLRAVTAFAEVVGDAPMWQQVTSGTPIGDVALKRLIFKTEGATYRDVRDAIASHRQDGLDERVTLVLERSVNASSTSEVRTQAGLESLSDVLTRDVRTPPVRGADLDRLAKRPGAKRLLDFGDDD